MVTTMKKLHNETAVGANLILFVLLSAASILGQESYTTDHKADKNLKSNARVNPSTLAMEFSIPLMSYPGRAGNSVPVTLNYSSKVWTMKNMDFLTPAETSPVMGGNGTMGDPNRIYTISSFLPEYSERSLAGWTTPGLQPLELKWDDQTYKIYDGGGYKWLYVRRVRAILPDGSSHELRREDRVYRCAGFGVNDNCSASGFYDWDGTYISVDGSGMRFEVPANILYMPDGSRYEIDGTDYEYFDKHGNKSVYDSSTRTFTDSVGREITNPLGTSASAGTGSFTLPGKNSNDLSYSKKYEVLKPSGCTTGSQTECDGAGLEDLSDALYHTGNDSCATQWGFDPLSPFLFDDFGDTYTDRTEGPPTIFYRDYVSQRMCNGGSNGLFNPVVLTELALPDGSKYKFRYNRYGEITKIIYPTGAYERFVYGYDDYGNFPFSQTDRGVRDRYISEDGTTETQHWTYTMPAGNVVETVSPDDTKTILTKFQSPYANFGYEDPRTGMPTDEKVYSAPTGSPGTRKILRRELTDLIAAPSRYSNPNIVYDWGMRDGRAAKKISIIFEPGEANALAQMVETTYGSETDQEYFAHLNATSVKTHKYVAIDAGDAETEDFATIAAYFSSSTVEKVVEMDYVYNSNYKARNITGLVSETRLKDPSGNVKAKTQITYDDGTYYPLITTDADSAHWQNPSTNYRGLVTGTKTWTDIAGNTSIETHAQYDLLGNLRKAWDANGNLSQLLYSEDYDRAYPTTSISPIPDASGTQGSDAELETATTYDADTGLLLTVTNPNGAVTVMEYEDPLLRPTKVIAPNDAETITEYGEADSSGQFPASERFVKTKTQIDTNKWKEAFVWFDGLGRTVRSQSVDDDGDVSVLTCYDLMSRVEKVTNPFRGYSNQTCSTTTGLEWTTNTLDTYARPWKVTTPDGAVAETTYGLSTSGSQVGTVITVEDQAGKLRRSVTNGLGQLIRVDEPNLSGALGSLTSPNQPTLYSYDFLGNLTQIFQEGDNTDECGSSSSCSQTRTFAYDAMSRLKQATNPESGTINYTYDSNSNLATKTDPRNITTTFVYDRLNRVKTRQYTNEPGGSETPDVSYFYDNVTNAKGKLTKVSSSVSTTEYTGFDILGRVTASKQTTDGTDYNSGYTFNLGGALIEQTYPSGRVVKNVIDGNGDLSLVQSKKNATFGYWNYASSFTYSASDALTGIQFGNGRWESTTFNSRLQPTQIALGTTPGSTNLLDLDYSYGTTANNGNVLSQTITVPTVGSYTGFTAVQNYSYDSLNRLQSAYERPDGWSESNCTTDPTKCWKQTFKFDRYGNRRFDESNTTMPTSFTNQALTNPTISSSTNRLTSSGWAYDTSGNTTDDPNGRQFVYDAENKQVKVLDNQDDLIGEYWYDGDGKRVRKHVPSTGEVTVFVYDASGRLIAEYSTIVASTNDAKVGYLTNDHLGSPRINTDSNGAVTARHDYHPFGEETASSQRTSGLGYASDTVRKRFTGYERDDETDLDLAQARAYSSNLGRFLSPDWFAPDINAPQTVNRYQYCLGNPLRFVDRNGKYEEDVHKDLTAALAYAAGFSQNQSEIIGRSNQHVDDNPESNPESILNYSARRDYHFTTQERRDRLWEIFSNNVGVGNNAEAFSALGTFFHAQQDSFSHEGFDPLTGQVPSGFRPGVIGTSWESFWSEVRKVDKTDFDPGKAERMAADTFSRLLRARNMMENRGRYGAFNKPIDYSLIKDDVARWVRADEKTKPKIMIEMKMKIDRWISSQRQEERHQKRRTKVRVRVTSEEE